MSSGQRLLPIARRRPLRPRSPKAVAKTTARRRHAGPLEALRVTRPEAVVSWNNEGDEAESVQLPPRRRFPRGRRRGRTTGFAPEGGRVVTVGTAGVAHPMWDRWLDRGI